MTFILVLMLLLTEQRVQGSHNVCNDRHVLEQTALPCNVKIKEVIKWFAAHDSQGLEI